MNEFGVVVFIILIISAVLFDRRREKNFTPEQRMKYEEAKLYFSSRKMAKKSRKRQKHNERRHI